MTLTQNTVSTLTPAPAVPALERSIHKMSNDYKIVNPAKRQYFDIMAFGELDKYPLRVWGNTDGKCLHAFALSYLLSHPSNFSGYLFGAWSGDAIFFPSENHEADDNGFSFGIYTACETDPKRSLYFYSVDEYSDISSEIVDAICDWEDEILKTLITRATSAESKPYQLSKILIQILTRNHSNTITASTFRHFYKDSADKIIGAMKSFVDEFDAEIAKYR